MLRDYLVPSLRWLALGGLLAVGIIAFFVMLGSPVDLTDRGSAEEGEQSSITNLLDRADAQTENLRRVKSLANRRLVQWLAGVGLGIAVGLTVAGYVMFRYQRKQLEEQIT